MDSNVPGNSFHTEDDYSFINRPQGPSLQIPTAYRRDDSNSALPARGNEDFSSSPLANGIVGDNEHLATSYHALGTAYEHMKRRLSEVEQINKSLTRRLKATSTGNTLERSSSSQSFMSTTHESDVAKAWEAYSDKCKECEKLRDDLREAEQKALQHQIEVRDSTFREDNLRAESIKEDYKKQLQQADLDIRDHKNKLEMALENLQKEKEYTEIVRQSAEERHHKMQATIDSLHQAFQEESRKSQDLVKELDKQRMVAQELLEKQENQFKEKIHEMEGRILQDREERTILDQKVVELERWKQDMESYRLSSGVPVSLSMIQQQRLEAKDQDLDSNSDGDAMELMNELHSLTDEIAVLKKQASFQSSMLAKICDDPRVQESISSIACNGFDGFESSDFSRPLLQPSPVLHSGASSVQPSIDSRQIVASGSDISSKDLPADIFSHPLSSGSPRVGATQGNARGSPIAMNTSQRPTPWSGGLVSQLDISRRIHTVESSGLDPGVTGRNSPQKIDIPPMSANLSNAFTNIRNNMSAVNEVLQNHPNAEQEDTSTDFYSAVADPAAFPNSTNPAQPSQRSNRESLSSDSGTTSSNLDTLTDNIAALPLVEQEGDVPTLVAAKDRLPQRYAVADFGNHSATGYAMQAIWPSAGKSAAAKDFSPIWPPNAMSSGNHSSYEVINDPVADGAPQPREKRKSDLSEYFQKAGAREFKVQPVNRASLPRDAYSNPSSALKHPSAIPTNRARTGEFSQTSSATNTSRRRPDRRSSAVEQEETPDDRAFVPGGESSQCPMCSLVFSAGTTESYMQRHINAHFSEDDNDMD